MKSNVTNKLGNIIHDYASHFLLSNTQRYAICVKPVETSRTIEIPVWKYEAARNSMKLEQKYTEWKIITYN